VDKQGVEYIAVIEALDFPIYGVQFHPEKNPYELGQYPDGRMWKSIDHSYNAIMTSQAFAHFFVEEARKNGHRFSSPKEEAAALLYNYPTSNQSYPDFEEIYVFKKS
jgi:gamma-glutamyl hydrolase